MHDSAVQYIVTAAAEEKLHYMSVQYCKLWFAAFLSFFQFLGFTVNDATSPGWLMVLSWLGYVVALALFFREPSRAHLERAAELAAAEQLQRKSRAASDKKADLEKPLLSGSASTVSAHPPLPCPWVCCWCTVAVPRCEGRGTLTVYPLAVPAGKKPLLWGSASTVSNPPPSLPMVHRWCTVRSAAP